MSNCEKGNNVILQEVMVLKLVSRNWMYLIPVIQYPNSDLTQKVNDEIEKITKCFDVKLTEYGTGTSVGRKVVSITFKIDEKHEEAEDTVEKIKKSIMSDIVPLI